MFVACGIWCLDVEEKRGKLQLKLLTRGRGEAGYIPRGKRTSWRFLPKGYVVSLRKVEGVGGGGGVNSPAVTRRQRCININNNL